MIRSSLKRIIGIFVDRIFFSFFSSSWSVKTNSIRRSKCVNGMRMWMLWMQWISLCLFGTSSTECNCMHWETKLFGIRSIVNYFPLDELQLNEWKSLSVFSIFYGIHFPSLPLTRYFAFIFFIFFLLLLRVLMLIIWFPFLFIFLLTFFSLFSIVFCVLVRVPTCETWIHRKWLNFHGHEPTETDETKQQQKKKPKKLCVEEWKKEENEKQSRENTK